jgi:hypothetical protein
VAKNAAIGSARLSLDLGFSKGSVDDIRRQVPFLGSFQMALRER